MTAEQIKACILGHAVGDALGVPVEFQSRAELAKNPVTDMRGFGTYPVPAGCWSDDTSMTLCALDSLAKGKLDLDDVMNHFGEWYYHDGYTPAGEAFDMGNTCSFAIDNYFMRHMDTEHCGLRGEQNNGNGSLMRILPFALYSIAVNGRRQFGRLWETVAAGSRLTHAHPRSVIACNLYATILAFLMGNQDKSAVAVGIAMHRRWSESGSAEYPVFGRVKPDVLRGLEESQIRSTGYVVDTLEAALWCLLTTDSYRECVLKAVNLGDDTDTVAAVAGGLAGVLYGLESIPKEWLATLKKREEIEALCEKAAQTWQRKKISTPSTL